MRAMFSLPFPLSLSHSLPESLSPLKSSFAKHCMHALHACTAWEPGEELKQSAEANERNATNATAIKENRRSKYCLRLLSFHVPLPASFSFIKTGDLGKRDEDRMRQGYPFFCRSPTHKRTQLADLRACIACCVHSIDHFTMKQQKGEHKCVRDMIRSARHDMMSMSNDGVRA